MAGTREQAQAARVAKLEELHERLYLCGGAACHG